MAHQPRISHAPPRMPAQPGTGFTHNMRTILERFACSMDIPDVDGKIHWRISQKHAEALTNFNGTKDYKYWKSRMKDHVSHTWMVWRHLLDAAGAPDGPIMRAELEQLDVRNNTNA